MKRFDMWMMMSEANSSAAVALGAEAKLSQAPVHSQKAGIEPGLLNTVEQSAQACRLSADILPVLRSFTNS